MNETPQGTAIAVLDSKMDRMKLDLADVKQAIVDLSDKMGDVYVTKEVFDIRVGRLESIVYGVVGAFGIAIVTAIATIVIK